MVKYTSLPCWKAVSSGVSSAAGTPASSSCSRPHWRCRLATGVPILLEHLEVGSADHRRAGGQLVIHQCVFACTQAEYMCLASCAWGYQVTSLDTAISPVATGLIYIDG